jgi:hypothetical protein
MCSILENIVCPFVLFHLTIVRLQYTALVIFPLDLDKDSLFVVFCVQLFEMIVDTGGKTKGQNTKRVIKAVY